jgi:hypothetical protein
MGFRTVVVLNNDLAHEWSKDPELGQKIMTSASMLGYKDAYGRDRGDLQYGMIVEQVHADTQTVAFFDGYSGKAMAWSHWHPAQTNESRDLEILKALAEKLGYRVVKKTVKN